MVMANISEVREDRNGDTNIAQVMEDRNGDTKHF
jgi:hypothetical protein